MFRRFTCGDISFSVTSPSRGPIAYLAAHFDPAVREVDNLHVDLTVERGSQPFAREAMRRIEREDAEGRVHLHLSRDETSGDRRTWLTYDETFEYETLGLSARRAVRDTWVQKLRRSEAVVLHASAVFGARSVIAFTGAKYAGKSTLLMSALTTSRCQFLTNDNLVFLPAARWGSFTTLPFNVKLREPTFEEFSLQIRKMAQHNEVASAYLSRYEADRSVFMPTRDLLLPPAAFSATHIPVVDTRQRSAVFIDVAAATRGRATLLELDRAALSEVLLANLKSDAEKHRSAVDRLLRSAPDVRGFRFHHNGDVTELFQRLEGKDEHLGA